MSMGKVPGKYLGRGLEWRESDKTVLYLQLVIKGRKLQCGGLVPLYEGLVHGGSSVRELNSLPYCLLVCNWVVLLVVMEWTAAITGDRVWLFLGRKIWGTVFQGGNRSQTIVYILKVGSSVISRSVPCLTTARTRSTPTCSRASPFRRKHQKSTIL